MLQRAATRYRAIAPIALHRFHVGHEAPSHFMGFMWHRNPNEPHRVHVGQETRRAS
jgi:hypothetical protein